jgi:signal peptidase I
MDSTESIHEKKEKSKKESKKLHKIIVLIVVIAISFLIATQWISVLRIQSSAMSPTIDAGQIVIVFKKRKVQQGDIVAYRKKNKLFVKRVIAGQGQYVDIDLNGKVSVDHKRIKEDYVGELSLGKCDISLPHQVDQSHWFCIEDEREVSIDSRSSVIGDISEDEIEGVVVFSIWPLNKFRIVQ